MAVNLSPVGGVAAQFFTNTGAVLTGGKLYTYAAGTTTPAATFTSSQGVTAQPNPIVLDAAGRVPNSGEIWLTDGVNYKFVLKDSNDVLIATYDNISGINSNFISFTNSQQIITATASQTVFNLSISYQPGTNSLSVFVDGVNQYGPGAQYAYIETDSDTVTFVSGLHVGAEVKFTTTQQQGAGVTNASQITYDPAGTGAVATNVQAKLRESISVKDFGAVGDGSTDDTAAIQAALDAVPAFGSLYFPQGTYIVGSTLSLTTDNVKIYGNAKLKAKNSTNFINILEALNRTNVVLEGLEFDANKAGRASGQSTRFACVSFNGTINSTIRNVTVRNALGFGGLSATPIAASGPCSGLLVTGCRFLDCGTSATTLASDGIFVRGNHCIVENCYASGITDTAFVLEGCNYSRISNCTVESSTAFAAITNDTSSNCVGNQINDLTGSCLYVGSTGGVIAVGCFGAGNILDSSISNVTVRLLDAATNLGPLVQVRTSSTGRVIGLTLNDFTVDSGVTVAKVAQAFLISDSDDVQINDPYIRLDASLGSSGIRFDGTCVNGSVNGGFISGADFGTLAKNTSAVNIRNTIYKSQGSYGIYAADTSTVFENQNRISLAGISALFKDAGATLRAMNWQAYTPVFSTDIGNAAASFSGAVTVNLARFSRSGNTVTVAINYTATLLAITPNYIVVTMPPGVSSIGDSTNAPASVSNSFATYETGIVRCIQTGTSSFRVYRANLANYSSGAAIEGRFALTFEAEN